MESCAKGKNRPQCPSDTILSVLNATIMTLEVWNMARYSGISFTESYKGFAGHLYSIIIYVSHDSRSQIMILVGSFPRSILFNEGVIFDVIKASKGVMWFQFSFQWCYFTLLAMQINYSTNPMRSPTCQTTSPKSPTFSTTSPLRENEINFLLNLISAESFTNTWELT